MGETPTKKVVRWNKMKRKKGIEKKQKKKKKKKECKEKDLCEFLRHLQYGWHVHEENVPTIFDICKLTDSYILLRIPGTEHLWIYNYKEYK